MYQDVQADDARAQKFAVPASRAHPNMHRVLDEKASMHRYIKKADWRPALSRNRHLQHIMMQGQPKFAPESQTLLVIHQHIELNSASTLSGELGKSHPRESLSIATSSKRRSNVQGFDEPRGLLGERVCGQPKTDKASYLFLHTSQPEAMPPSRCSLRDSGNPPVHRFLPGFLSIKFAIVFIG